MKGIFSLALCFSAVYGAEYLIGVGKDETTGQKGMGFDPSVIHPVVGDVIAFEFNAGSHSVVQSTFETPCQGNGGYNSGVRVVDNSLPVDADGLPQTRITVNDTNPIWFFDEAGGLCRQGAVLAVNPQMTGAFTAAAFKERARNSPPPAPTSSTPAPPPSGTESTSPSETNGPNSASTLSSIPVWLSLAASAASMLF